MNAAPPVLTLIERLQVQIELAVLRFPRRHRYACGEDLRRGITEVARMANRAWRDRARAGMWTQELVWAVDELKTTLRIGKTLHAFQSLGQFEALIRLSEEVGRQCGGWNRQCNRDNPSKGQSPAARHRQPGRAQTLSAPAASHGGYR